MSCSGGVIMSRSRRTSKTRIRASLLDQLEAKGAALEHFTDLVKDYMSLWEVKNKLIKDIKTRGVMYKDYSSVGVEMQKNNPSVKELVGVNRQMLALLKELGLSTSSVTSVDDDEM